MKRRLLLVLLLTTISWAKSPCEDSVYLDLKSRSIDSLSEREYDYFKHLDKGCLEYNSNLSTAISNSSKKIGNDQKQFRLNLEMNQKKTVAGNALYFSGTALNYFVMIPIQIGQAVDGDVDGLMTSTFALGLPAVGLKVSGNVLAIKGAKDAEREYRMLHKQYPSAGASKAGRLYGIGWVFGGLSSGSRYIPGAGVFISLGLGVARDIIWGVSAVKAHQYVKSIKSETASKPQLTVYPTFEGFGKETKVGVALNLSF